MSLCDLVGSADVGVYVGVFDERSNDVTPRSVQSMDCAGGNVAGVTTDSRLGGRISSTFDFQGPCLTVKATCASGLIALVQAMEDIRRGICRFAFVSGFNLLSEAMSEVLSSCGLLSTSGECAPFCASRNGYVRSDGIVTLLIGSVANAQDLQAGQHLALRSFPPLCYLVEGKTAHSGRPGRPFASPSAASQKSLIQKTCNHPLLRSFNDFVLIESHGVGSTDGDEAEWTALCATYGARSNHSPLLVGRSKTLLGHTEASSGLLSVLKVCLCVLRNFIPPDAGCSTLDDRLRNANLKSCLQLCDRGFEPSQRSQYFAAVHATGFAGEIVHVVLSSVQDAHSAPWRYPAVLRSDHMILNVSRETESVFVNTSASQIQLQDVSRSVDHCAAVDLACPLQICGRGAFDANNNLIPAVFSRDGKRIAANLQVESDADCENADSSVSVVFLFPGQGSFLQKDNMKNLYACSPVFADAFDKVDSIAGRLLGVPKPCAHFNGYLNDDAEFSIASMDHPSLVPLCIFATQYSLCHLLKCCGVSPKFALGHSLGEICSLLISGFLSLDTAVCIVFHRSVLAMHCLRDVETSMMACFCSADVFEKACETSPLRKHVDICGKNSPCQTVVCGAREDVQALLTFLTGEIGVACCILPQLPAFHSRFLDSAHADFQHIIEEIVVPETRFGPTASCTCTMISSVTGDLLHGPLEAAYLWRNFREIVDFNAAMQRLSFVPHSLLCIELGSSSTLSKFAREWLPSAEFVGAFGSANEFVMKLCSVLRRVRTRFCHPMTFLFSDQVLSMRPALYDASLSDSRKKDVSLSSLNIDPGNGMRLHAAQNSACAFPPSSFQLPILLDCEEFPYSTAYNFFKMATVAPSTSRELVLQSLLYVSSRADAVRCIFEKDAERFVAHVLDQERFAVLAERCVMEYVRFTSSDQSQSDILSAFVRKPFETLSRPLIRIALLRLHPPVSDVSAETTLLLVCCCHHLIADARGLSSLVQMMVHYISRYPGSPPSTADPPSYFAWARTARAIEGITILPEGISKCTTVRGRFSDDVGESAQCTVDASESVLLRQFSTDLRVTFATFLFSAWAFMIGEMFSLDEVVLSVPVDFRSRDRPCSSLIGTCVQLMPLTVSMVVDGKPVDFDKMFVMNVSESLRTIVTACRASAAAAGSALVTSRASAPSGVHRSVSIANYITEDDRIPSAENVPSYPVQASLWPMQLVCTYTHGKVILEVKFIPDDVNDSDLVQFLRSLPVRFRHFLSRVVNLGFSRAVPFSFLLDDEVRFYEYFASKKSSETEFRGAPAIVKHILDLSCAGCQWRSKFAVCNSDGTFCLSYFQFASLAMEVANLILAESATLDVSQNTPICIFLPRSAFCVVCMFACWLAGFPYSILDSGMPISRLQNLLELLQPQVCLSLVSVDCCRDSAAFSKLRKLILLDRFLQHGHLQNGSFIDSTEILNALTDPRRAHSHIAYVLFTSGSTGQPKGPVVLHAGLLNLMKFCLKRFEMSSNTRCLSLSPFTHDMSIVEIWGTLFAGGTVVVSLPHQNQDPFVVVDLLQTWKANFIQATPTLLRVILDAKWRGDSSATVVAGGEALQTDLASRLINAFGKVFNVYGPTEATDYSACLGPLQDEDVLEASGLRSCLGIGTPIDNALLFCASRCCNILPHGIPGELCVSGILVGAGYWRDAALTADKFVQLSGIGVVYKTGDICRFMYGKYYWISRRDGLVKISGFRVSLEEVENELMKHEHIKFAAAFCEQRGHNTMLFAVVSLQNNARDSFDVHEFRTSLRKRVPHYMIPSQIRVVDSFPVSEHKKLDRKQLGRLFEKNPSSDSHHSFQRVSVSPEAGRFPEIPSFPGLSTTSRLQAILQVITECWRSLLPMDVHAPSVGFFDAGGSSILLARLLILYRDRFPEAKVSRTDLLQFPTIETQHAMICDRLRCHPAYPPADSASNGRELLLSCRQVEAKPVFLNTNANASAIAIVGFWGELPGCGTTDDLIDRYRSCDPCISRCQGKAQDGELVCSGGNLEFSFDRGFLQLSSDDVSLLDPQLKILIHSVWMALQNASIDPFRVSKASHLKIGIFIGVTGSSSETDSVNLAHVDVTKEYHRFTCSGSTFFATRIAHFFDFHGPALTIQTACSSSLVATHYARLSILNGDCDIAVAGGVYYNPSRTGGYRYREGSIFSPDGTCRPFSHTACGTVPSEGCGVVILQREDLCSALNTCAVATILNSVVNNDGAEKVSFAAPSVKSQIDLLRSAYQIGTVDSELFDNVSFIECHGTGTALGDEMELKALSEVFGARNRKLVLGSVKSLIGHTDAAAGVCGLISTLVCMQHQVLPSCVHFEGFRNPSYAAVLSMHSTMQSWHPPKSGARVAGVSSFGMGGTNCHVVIKQSTHNAVIESDCQVCAPTVSPAGCQVQDSRVFPLLVSHMDLQRLREYLVEVQAYMYEERKQHSSIDWDWLKSVCCSSMHYPCLPIRGSLVVRVTAEGELVCSEPVVCRETSAPPSVHFVLFVRGSAWNVFVEHCTFAVTSFRNQGALLDDSSKLIGLMIRFLRNIVFVFDDPSIMQHWRITAEKCGTTAQLVLLSEQHHQNVSTVSSAMELPSEPCTLDSFIRLLSSAWVGGAQVEWSHFLNDYLGFGAFKPTSTKMPIRRMVFHGCSRRADDVDPSLCLYSVHYPEHAVTGDGRRRAMFRLTVVFTDMDCLSERLEQAGQQHMPGGVVVCSPTGLCKEAIFPLSSPWILPPEKGANLVTYVSTAACSSKVEIVFSLSFENQSRADFKDVACVCDVLKDVLLRCKWDVTIYACFGRGVFGDSRHLSHDAGFSDDSRWREFAVSCFFRCACQELGHPWCVVHSMEASFAQSLLLPPFPEALFSEAAPQACREMLFAGSALRYRVLSRLSQLPASSLRLTASPPKVTLPVVDTASSITNNNQSSNEDWLLVGCTGRLGSFVIEACTAAATCVSTLFITTRSPFPHASQWLCLSSDTMLPVWRRRLFRVLCETVAKGFIVNVVTLDMKNAEEIRGLLSQLPSQSPVTLLYFSGLVSRIPVREVSIDDTQQSIQSRVPCLGSLVRHFAFEKVVVASSMSAVLGGVGFCPYSVGTAAVASSVTGRDSVVCFIGGVETDRDLNGGTSSVHGTHQMLRGTEFVHALAYVIVHYNDVPRHVIISANMRPEDSLASENVAWNNVQSKCSTVVANASERESVDISLSSITSRILGIFKKYTTTAVDDSADFFRSGGDSFRALQILEEVRQSYGVRLPISAIVQNSTARKLAVKVLSGLYFVSPVHTLEPKSLIVMQLGTNQELSPLFLLHPVGGTTAFYVPLVSALGPERTVVSFESFGLAGTSAKFDVCVRGMCERYLKEASDAGYSGPYHLAGSSFGGMLCFEMACMIGAQSVSSLIMIDTPGGHQMPDRITNDVEVLSYLWGEATGIGEERLQSMSKEERKAAILRAGQSRGEFPLNVSSEIFGKYIDCFVSNVDAMFSYIPQNYGGRGTFIFAKVRRSMDALRPFEAWTPYFENGLEVIEVEGDHISMNKHPFVEIVAGVIRSRLEDARIVFSDFSESPRAITGNPLCDL
eukprot:ANDGO_00341.mRNA.1 Polyketide synthase PksN